MKQEVAVLPFMGEEKELMSIPFKRKRDGFFE